MIYEVLFVIINVLSVSVIVVIIVVVAAVVVGG